MTCFKEKVTALRAERQFLAPRAGESEYISLYRDTQPGQNVYWNGFGAPPSLSHRADFDDIEFNRARQLRRELVKGRFAGGNLGWVMREDMELFACLYRRRSEITPPAARIFELIGRSGPLTIRQLKEETGMPVKEITPALHRLQESFLVYEDQYDGEWDRGWYLFTECFPGVSFGRYSRREALGLLLRGFACRHVRFDPGMARAFYRLPEKEIAAAAGELEAEGVMVGDGEGCYMLAADAALLGSFTGAVPRSVFALHRNDFLVKSHEPELKKSFAHPGHDTLQYLLIDGEFRGATYGRFRNGPYDLEDVAVDIPDAAARRAEIMAAVSAVNYGGIPKRFMGEDI